MTRLAVPSSERAFDLDNRGLGISSMEKDGAYIKEEFPHRIVAL